MHKTIMSMPSKMLAIAATMTLASCGGGDVGPSEFVYGSAPRCAKTLLVEDGLSHTQLALTKLHELINLASISPASTEETDGPEQAESGQLYEFDIEGQCGGWVLFTPLDGDATDGTDYKLELENYCMPSAEGDISFSGQIYASELAEMGVASELQTQFTDLQAVQGDQSFVISMSDARTVYGRTSTGRPLAPQADSPDQIAIGQLVVNHQTAKGIITDSVEALQSERWEEDGLVITRVKDGRYLQNSTGDVFDLSTPKQPLQVDAESGEWLAGVLVLSSKGRPDVHVRPTGKAGEYTAVVPANTAGERLGCGVVDNLSSGR